MEIFLTSKLSLGDCLTCYQVCLSEAFSDKLTFTKLVGVWKTSGDACCLDAEALRKMRVYSLVCATVLLLMWSKHVKIVCLKAGSGKINFLINKRQPLKKIS